MMIAWCSFYVDYSLRLGVYLLKRGVHLLCESFANGASPELSGYGYFPTFSLEGDTDSVTRRTVQRWRCTIVAEFGQ